MTHQKCSSSEKGRSVGRQPRKKVRGIGTHRQPTAVKQAGELEPLLPMTCTTCPLPQRGDRVQLRLISCSQALLHLDDCVREGAAVDVAEHHVEVHVPHSLRHVPRPASRALRATQVRDAYA